VALYYLIASKANRAFFLIKLQGTFLKAGLEFSTAEKINGKSKHRKKPVEKSTNNRFSEKK